MNPHSAHVRKAPAWALSLPIACIGMLGPFAIDTYLPAFAGIRAALGATALEMPQTLSAYLFACAAVNLFHGALADSFGRRPVILAGVALFTAQPWWALALIGFLGFGWSLLAPARWRRS
jgi:DHA1 family bicyclomycin/chloramphenicol resistance-like MFS transporter